MGEAIVKVYMNAVNIRDMQRKELCFGYSRPFTNDNVEVHIPSDWIEDIIEVNGAIDYLKRFNIKPKTRNQRWFKLNN